MTNRTIRVYEETTGDIRRFPVSNDSLPEHPEISDEGDINVRYVYEEREIERIKRSKRKLDDIAVIVGRSVGRGGKEVVNLVWAKDMHTGVILYEEASGF